MGSEAIESTGAEYEFNEIRLAALADLASVDEDGIYDDSEVSGLIVEWFEVIGFEHLRVILAGPQVAEGFTGNFAQAARTAGYQYCGRAVRYLPDLDKHAIVLKAYRKNGER